jgi:hypothetical protein
MGPVEDPQRVRGALPAWLIGAEAEQADEVIGAPPRRPAPAQEHASGPARERRWAVLSAAALGALVLGTLWLGSGTPAAAVQAELPGPSLPERRDPSLPVAADVLAGLAELQRQELPIPTF